jgi:hypothetical protein
MAIRILLRPDSSQRKLLMLQSIILNYYQGENMKKLLFIMIAAFALNAIPVVYADDELPEIAPVDDPAIPPLDAPAPADDQ